MALVSPVLAGAIGGLDYDNGVGGGARCAAGSYSNIWGPSGDGAIKSGEEKGSGRTWSQNEVRRTRVSDRAGGSARGESLAVGICFWDSDNEWDDGSSAVVKSA